MAYASMNNNIGHYNQVSRVSGVTDADPHRLVQMLLEGALGKIAAVKGLMQRNDTAKKGALVSQAISIIVGLRSSLNKAAGGEIAENLDRLYEYMEGQLLKANIKNDTSILDEVTGLLKEVKAGWEAIPHDIRMNESKPVAAAHA